MTRSVAIALALLAAACSSEVRPAAEPSAVPGESRLPAPEAVEVFRLESRGPTALRLSGMVPTTEGRSVLLTEVRRRWPGRRIVGDLTVQPSAPALWVPEAVAVLAYVAAIEDGGLLVTAAPGAAGGGSLTITGRVPDERALARIAADAGASVAPPFVVLTPVDVGVAIDSLFTGSDEDRPPVIVDAGPGAEEVARAVEQAIGDGALAFAPGSAVLTTEARQVLRRVAETLHRYPDATLEVSASADGSGSPSLDGALRARRAEALVEALRAGGIPDSRLGTTEREADRESSVTFRVSTAAIN